MEKLIKILLEQKLKKKKYYKSDDNYILLNDLTTEINLLEMILFANGQTQYVYDLEKEINNG